MGGPAILGLKRDGCVRKTLESNDESNNELGWTDRAMKLEGGRARPAAYISSVPSSPAASMLPSWARELSLMGLVELVGELERPLD